MTIDQIITELQTRFIMIPRAAVGKNHNYYAQGAIEPVIQTVCNYYGVPREILLSSAKGDANVCECRYVICHLASTDLHISFSQIARLLNRNHASVLTAVRRVGERIEFNREFRHNYDKIKALLPAELMREVAI